MACRVTSCWVSRRTDSTIKPQTVDRVAGPVLRAKGAGLKFPAQSADQTATNMERRLNERHTTNLNAEITVVGKRERSCSGQVIDISQSGVALSLPLQLLPDEQVRLDIEESVLYGRVAHSDPDGILFRTGIEVYRVVLGGTDLAHLLQTILRQQMPTVPGVEQSEIYWG